MAQDVVTARDVAAAGAGPQFPNAERIRQVLDEALAAESFRRTAYSNEVLSLFQQAWAVAAHRRSRQVTIFHLAYALVFNHRKAGTEMAECLGSDVEAFAVGCILQLMPLGVSTGDADVVPPAVGTVRWVGEAIALARRRGQPGELLPEHLIRVVLEGTVPDHELARLRTAARVGRARIETVLGPRPTPPMTPVAPCSPGDIITHMEKVEGAASIDGGVSATELRALLEEFAQRQTVDADDQKRTLTRIESLIEKRSTQITQRVMPIDDVIKKLGVIEQQVVAVAEALPRPPSGARLAAAIVAVLAIGIAAGMALTQLQPGTPVAQTMPASAK
jgi:hypothetical protein